MGPVLTQNLDTRGPFSSEEIGDKGKWLRPSFLFLVIGCHVSRTSFGKVTMKCGSREVFSLGVFITCAVAVFCTMAVGIGATVLVALLACAAPLEALVAAGAGWRVIACGRPWGKKNKDLLHLYRHFAALNKLQLFMTKCV